MTKTDDRCGHGRAVVWAPVPEGRKHALQSSRQIRRALLAQADVAEDSTHSRIVPVRTRSEVPSCVSKGAVCG